MSKRTLRIKLRRDLAAKRPQFIAIGLSFLLGSALFVMSYDAFQNLESSYLTMYERTHFADLTVTGATPALVSKARSLGATVAERSVADVPMRIADTALLGRVVGMPPGQQPPVDGFLVESGTLPGTADEAMVEQHAADHFGLSEGSRVQVHGPDGWHTLTVSGVAASPEYLWPARSRQDILTSADDFAVLFVPQDTAAALGGEAAQHQLLVYVPDRSRVAPVVDALSAQATAEGADEVLTLAEQPSNAALQEDVQGFNELSFLFPMLFLAAAAMAAWVLLTRLVQSQRSQIGTLRAFGAERRTIVGHYVGFGLLVGALGSIPGAVLGEALARFVTRAYTGAISVPIVVTPLRPATVLIGIVFGLLVGTLGAMGPALAASRVPPAEAMRGLVPAGGGRLSLLERAIPPVRRLPVVTRMAIRNIGRNRRRSLYTILGVVLALVLILVSWGMLDTTEILLARQFDEVQLQDAQVYTAGPADPAEVAQVAAVQGVTTAEAATQVPASISSPQGSYATQLSGMQPDTTMHTFVAPDGDVLALPADGVLLGVALKDLLGVSIGDQVRIDLPSTGTTLEERVAGFVSEPLGTFAYVSRSQLAAAPNTILLRFDPGTDPAAVRRAVSALPGVTAYVDTRSLQRAADSFMSLFWAFIGLMLIFGGILAFVLVFNAMSVNVAERATEIATLRAEGVDAKRVGRLIGSENLFITIAGIVPGLLVGYLVAKSFMASFSSDLFTFDLAIRPMTFVWCALSMVVVALVSQWPALRAVGRIDLAAVLRERTG